jgi:hypothetical protein
MLNGSPPQTVQAMILRLTKEFIEDLLGIILEPKREQLYLDRQRQLFIRN